jgi:antitoxin HigA-1
MSTKRKEARRVRKVHGRDAMEFLDELLGPMTLGNTLRAIREADELSQAELARRLGITRSHICDIEKGRKVVSAERAAHIAKTLGYSPTVFVQLALQDQLREAGLKMKVEINAA